MSELEIAINTICEKLDKVAAIYVFGSYGTTWERKTSDLDLAVLCKEKVDNVILWNIAQEVAIKIDRNVDLLNLRQISTVMQFQVISSGKCIYCDDELQRGTFELYVLKEYWDHQARVKDLIENIKQRGSIYG